MPNICSHICGSADHVGTLHRRISDTAYKLQLQVIFSLFLFFTAIYQKAEALYHLGDFEHSLVFYHRGLHVRPELEQFRLGVQKAREAIENAIGKFSDKRYFFTNNYTQNDIL